MTSVNSKTYVNNYQTPNQESNLPGWALGLSAGSASAFGLREVVKAAKKPYMDKLLPNLNSFTPAENDIMIKEAQRMVEESGISKKGFNGIRFIDLNLKSQNKDFDIKEYIKNNFTNKVQTEILPKGKLSLNDAEHEVGAELIDNLVHGNLKSKLNFAGILVCGPFVTLANALTGVFKPKIDNKIKMSLKWGMFSSVISNKIYTATPQSALHEVGHAINHNSSFLSKVPSRLRLLATFVAAPLVILNAMFTQKPKKNNDVGPKKSLFNKLKDFTRKNLVLTMSLLSTPLLLEEAIASKRAIKFANASKSLTESMKKQHSKTLKLAFGTYLIGMATAVSAVKLAVWIKDEIVKRTDKK